MLNIDKRNIENGAAIMEPMESQSFVQNFCKMDCSLMKIDLGDIPLKVRAKKSRKAITLQKKLDVLRLYEAGQKTSAISRHFKLPHSTIRTIRANAQKIQERASVTSSLECTVITKTRSIVLQKMEGILLEWINELNRQNIPLNAVNIQQKAKTLFESLKIEAGESAKEDTFLASRGWFDRFKNRHHVKFNQPPAGTEAPRNEDDTMLATSSLISGENIESTNACFDVKSLEVFANGESSTSSQNWIQMPTTMQPSTFPELAANNLHATETSVSNDPQNLYSADIQIKDEPIDYEIPSAHEEFYINESINDEQLSEALEHLDKAMEIFSNCDLNRDRSRFVNQVLTSGSAPYRELYIQMKQSASQKRIDEYFKPMSSTIKPKY